VPVPVRQEDGTVRNDRVQIVFRRASAREHVHGPPAPEDPRLARVGFGVRGDRREIVGLRIQIVQVALEHVDAGGHRMDVRVLEPGDEHPAGEVDHLGPAADGGTDVVVGPDEGDAPVAHRDGLRPGSRRVHRVDGAVHEDEVRRRSVASHRTSRLEVVGSVPSYASATRSK
jgi:hypothetical protein